MNAITIERIVRGVATDFGLPVELASVVASGEQWEIVVKDSARGRPRSFWIYDGPPAAMRTAIKDRLDALLGS